MATARQRLIRVAVDWLVEWNFKAWLQEIGDPHQDDLLSGSTKEVIAQLTGSEPSDYVRRDYSSPEVALENAAQQFRLVSDREVVSYWEGLSDLAYTRLVNAVGRRARQRVDFRKSCRAFQSRFALGDLEVVNV